MRVRFWRRLAGFGVKEGLRLLGQKGEVGAEVEVEVEVQVGGVERLISKLVAAAERDAGVDVDGNSAGCGVGVCGGERGGEAGATVEASAPSETRSRNSRFVVLVIETPLPIARVAFAFAPFHVAADALLMVAFRTSSCHRRCVLCQ